MKKKMYVAIALSTVLIAGGSAGAQMMGDGQEMMRESRQQQERVPQAQDKESYMMGSYGMAPCVMGGYGMGPGMMDGYGMGRGMMGEYGWGQGSKRFSSPEKYEKFLVETKDLRKKMHDLRFEYGEMMHNPQTTVGELNTKRQEMQELQKKIQQKAEE
ncbi:MAG: hypothetical protein M8357_12925 [Desulfobulbaceae bacterium]|nr:hypothetical protein [Desulfobulbaceae bacterium]